MKVQVDIIPDQVDEDGQPIYSSVEDAIVEELKEQIAEKARAVVDRIVADKVAKQIEDYALPLVAAKVDAILAGPIERTDPYGNKKLPPTTITEMVVKGVNDYLGIKLDDYGRQSWDGKDTPVSYHIKQIATKVLNDEIVKQTADLRTKLIQEIATKLVVGTK